jgi:peptide/nickel transport system ATP-binding protein
VPTTGRSTDKLCLSPPAIPKTGTAYADSGTAGAHTYSDGANADISAGRRGVVAIVIAGADVTVPVISRSVTVRGISKAVSAVTIAAVAIAAIPTSPCCVAPHDAAAYSITAYSITADSITADSITADSITADSITADSITADLSAPVGGLGRGRPRREGRDTKQGAER